MSKQSRARAATRAAATGARRVSPRGGRNGFSLRPDILMAGSLVVLAALVVYSQSFSGPIVLDDTWSITTNPSIRHLGSALFPPVDKGTGGRPLLNLTFALNYAQGGFSVWSYHALNLLIHILAGLTMFGIVRRSLTSHLMTRRSEISDLRSEISGATVLACAVAVIWTVHPLQTEAVTYISQRAESLMGLFYLLTLYCFIRGTKESEPRVQSRESRENPTSPGISRIGSRLSTLSSRLWYSASILACLLSALSKETMITAPVMVFLYDRVFVSGSWREALRSRWWYYFGLACTWTLPAWSAMSLGQRSVGFGQGVTWWSYALTSCRSVVFYLKLAIWPHPLVFDYGVDLIQNVGTALPYALILAAVVVAIAVAWRYWPPVGFAGTWFLVILAPTSSVIPVADQPMAEHRMYLSLAAVATLGVIGLRRWIGRSGLVVCAAAAIGLGWLTAERNNDYRSALVLWSKTVAERPDNARARYNLGGVLHDIPGRMPEAVIEYEAAVRYHPDSALAHYNLANVLNDAGKAAAAVAEYKKALQIDPKDAAAHNNLASALLISFPDRLSEAISHYETALRLNPDYIEAHYNYGIALDRAGRISEAIAQYRDALQLKPDYAEVHYNLGVALTKIGRSAEAMTEYRRALQFKPDYAPARAALEQAGSQR
jgi:Flp pilus assembly protein TadD